MNRNRLVKSADHARVKGFTLIEVMIVVAIIGILIAVALPSYRNYVIKSNRAVAEAFMQNTANREEQYLLDARVYAEVATDADFSSVLKLPMLPEVTKFYDVKVANVGGNARTYEITATPRVGLMQATDGILKLDNLGTKTPSDKW